MKRLLTLFVFLVSVVFSNSIIAQEMGSFSKEFHFSIPEKIQRPLGDPISAGTYSHRYMPVISLQSIQHLIN